MTQMYPLAAFVLLTAFMLACTPKETTNYPQVEAPLAEAKPESLNIHGDTRVDNYFWLRDDSIRYGSVSKPEVIAYLEQESAYADTMLAHVRPLQDELFEEMKARLKEDDQSVPYKDGNYLYYTRFEEGGQYPIYCRKPCDATGEPTGDEQILLNVNELAEGYDYFNASPAGISTNEQLMAYVEDNTGYRRYNIRFKNLSNGQLLADEIKGTSGNVAWANDNRTVFYSLREEGTNRNYKIMRHTLGTPQSADVEVFHEKDPEFYCYVTKSKSKKYIMIGSQMTVSSEFWFLDASKPNGEFQLLTARQRGLEYSADHAGEHFYILTNHQAQNFRLVRAAEGTSTPEQWEEVIPHREDVLLEGFELFKDYLVTNEMADANRRIRIASWDAPAEGELIASDEQAFVARTSSNPEYDTPILRYTYTSLVQPNSTYDLNMATGERTLLKQTEVVGGYNADEYASERIEIEARDGTMIPVSLVYKKDMRQGGAQPLLQYAYGSYGSSTSASFSTTRLSLLNRGVIYAIAHVRGGQEKGRQWYEDGKLLNKINTFTDFIDVSKGLVAQGYTSNDQLFAYGGSAGGLLMGAIANMAPEQYKGIIAAVPFVDVVSTMLDESIPLTTFEFVEWGNPKDKEYYEYMLSYSPYDQVKAQAYPHMLVTSGLYDSQVQYWEPAKWVAKLRATKTDDRVLLFDIDMSSGHGGPSGRYNAIKRTALQYAWMMDLLGMATSAPQTES